MKDKKDSVLIVDNSLDITGALKAILDFSLHARSHFRFTFVLPRGSKAYEIVKSKGFDVVTLPFVEISKNFNKLLLYLPFLLVNGWRIRRIVEERGINIVHVNDFYNMSPIVAKLLGGRFKLITHIRFMPDRFPLKLVKAWVKMGLRYAEAVVCVSEAVKRFLPNHPKIRLIYDGLLQVEPYSLKEVKENAYVRLLYLGHFIPGKGQDYAIEAFALAYQENPRLYMKLVGGDMGLKKNKEFKASLIKRVKVLQLEEAVEFTGPTSNARDEIFAADLVLNFSESESFSFTCLEALNLGVPLIATDCGGPAELFVNKESGWLVANKDILSMKEAILHLSENLEIRKGIGLNSPIFVRRKFAKSNTFDRLKALYLNILDKP